MGCAGSRPGKRSCYGLSIEEPNKTKPDGTIINGVSSEETGLENDALGAKGTTRELEELTEDQMKKKEKPIKGLSEMNLGEFISIVHKTREKLDLDRAKGYTPKMVDLKLAAHVAQLKEPS